MGADDSDPRLTNASEDFVALAEKLGAQLHEANDKAEFKIKLAHILYHYGPSMLEAAIRVALKFGGVSIPPALPFD